MSNSPPHIVKETVYNHRPRDEDAERQFSFLMDTEENNKPPSSDLQTFLSEIRNISESLSLRMDRMDKELTRQICRQTNGQIDSSAPYSRTALASRGLVNINTESDDMFGCKELIVENRQFETSSNFQIDEHQNFVKIRNSSNAPTFGCSESKGRLPTIILPTISQSHDYKENIRTKKPPPVKTATTHRRVYESILEKFSTASLIAMNRQES